MTKIDLSIPPAIEPALTTGQWANENYHPSPAFSIQVHEVDDGRGIVIGDGGDCAGIYRPSDLLATIALANHALPDNHPLKIELGMVQDISRAADLVPSDRPHMAAGLRVYAARLAALIPPF
jgi:hypothetical protein